VRARSRIGSRCCTVAALSGTGRPKRSIARATRSSTSLSTAAPRDRSRWRSEDYDDGLSGATGLIVMARQQARFVCQQGGPVQAKWTGRCDGCGAWNSLIEEFPREELPGGRLKGGPDRRGGRALGFVGLTVASILPTPRKTRIVGLDRVCGGGLVPGSAILVGGDPGIGKSTL